MNLRIKCGELEIELNNTDVIRFEKTLMATFAILEGGEQFIETYKNTIVDPKTMNSKAKHYIEAVDGVREHPNGVKEYQCEYNCSCGNRGKRFIHEDAETTTCHKCRGILKVQPSTDNDLHDEDYNYFVAYG